MKWHDYKYYLIQSLHYPIIANKLNPKRNMHLIQEGEAKDSKWSNP